MKKPIYLLILLSFFSFSDSFGQKGSYQLTFKGRDYYTHDTLSLDSIFIENQARNCDTTIYGTFPHLLLTWVTGVDEFTNTNGLQVAQNYPNPFAGSTKCTLKLPDKKDIVVTLTDVYGKQLAVLQKTLPGGTHTFTVETGAGGIYFLTINDGSVSKTLKLNSRNSSGQSSCRISYSGNEELPESSKKSTQSRGFTFLPGDALNIIYYKFGYEDKSASIQPSGNTVYIYSLKPDYLSFHTDSTWGYAPITATFNVSTNIPDLTSWHWDFGDGGTSDLENPTHVYTTSDTYYTVILTAQGASGSYYTERVNYIHALHDLADVNFAADITNGMAPMEVHFISHTNMENANMWYWTFGDGTTAQDIQNPVHTYNDVGVYTVSLTVYDNNGWKNETKEDYIYVNYCPSTVTDADGNVYHTVAIGSQCWMKENLNVGVKISGWDDAEDNFIIEKFCFDGLESNCDEYGGYYQYYEFMQYDITEGAQGICPDGWHIPSESDFDKLASTASEMPNGSGGELKEPGFNHWLPPNESASNGTRFTALGAGYLEKNSMYQYHPYWMYLKDKAYFGTTSPSDAFSLDSYSKYSSFQWLDVYYGVSIRCIKDQEE